MCVDSASYIQTVRPGVWHSEPRYLETRSEPRYLETRSVPRYLETRSQPGNNTGRALQKARRRTNEIV